MSFRKPSGTLHSFGKTCKSFVALITSFVEELSLKMGSRCELALPGIIIMSLSGRVLVAIAHSTLLSSKTSMPSSTIIMTFSLGSAANTLEINLLGSFSFVPSIET